MTDSDWIARGRALDILMRHHRASGTFNALGPIAAGNGTNTLVRRRGVNALAAGVQQKRRVFVSYHHAGDRLFYESFCKTFCDQFEVVHDNSPDRPIDSENPKYVWQRLREKHISGSSCTIVLAGRQTWGRKYVDWEIGATLEKQHGLIGVRLPSLLPTVGGPLRLDDNVRSGYAVWIDWAHLMQNPSALPGLIERARLSPKHLIENSRSPRYHNAPGY